MARFDENTEAVSVGELFGALCVVASVVEAVSEACLRPADECRAAENAVASLMAFCGF